MTESIGNYYGIDVDPKKNILRPARDRVFPTDVDRLKDILEITGLANLKPRLFVMKSCCINYEL